MLRHTAWYSLALVIPVAVHLASKAQSSLEDLHFAISRSSVTSVLELYLTVSPQPSKKKKTKWQQMQHGRKPQKHSGSMEIMWKTPPTHPFRCRHFIFTFLEGAAGPIQTNRTSSPSLATLWRLKINLIDELHPQVSWILCRTVFLLFLLLPPCEIGHRLVVGHHLFVQKRRVFLLMILPWCFLRNCTCDAHRDAWRSSSATAREREREKK